MAVLSYLRETANGLVLSQNEKTSIDVSINNLRSKLRDYFGNEIVEQIRFGSSTRGTILPRKADLKSDIDYMIVFNNSDELKPQTFIQRLKRFAESKYSRSEIHQSHPTVVLILNHIKFDLVPAYKNGFWGASLYIPAPKDDFMEWTATDPNGFNQKLSDANQSNNYLIKPMIRLVKYWNAQNNYVFESYELERSLVNKGFYNCYNLKDYFFKAIDGFDTWWIFRTK